MKSKWSKRTIGELCMIGSGKVQTGPFGSQLHQSDYSDEGTPVVMPADIVGGKLDERRIARVATSHVERLTRHKLQSGDIVYGRRGDIGRQALIRGAQSGWLCGTGCLRVRLGNSEVSADYLHRYLQMPEIIGWIQGQAIGATMPNLNTDILNRVPVYYPCRRSQDKIAAILTAYDDLIETYKRRIAVLEKIAEEIYREWFVRMRFPGYRNTRFVKSVPEGWPLQPLSALVKMNPREAVSNSDPLPFVGMENLSTHSMYFDYCQRRVGASGSKFRNRDTLLPRITPCLENGKRGFVSCLGEKEVGVGSTEFIVLREMVLPAEYIYLLSCDPSFRQHAELSMTGASGRQRVQHDCFDYFLIPTPPEPILAQFVEVARPLFQLVSQLATMNSRLSSTRDLLLPRLISGKLSVEDLDIQFPPSMEDAA